MNGNIAPRPGLQVTSAEDRWGTWRIGAFLLVFVCLASSVATPQGAGGSAEKIANRRQQQEEELRRFVSQLHPLSQEKSQDPEVQLGLAILYDQYGGQDDPRYQKAKAKLNRVLELDPENKAVWAVRAKDAAYLAIARGKDFVEDLEGAIDNAKKRGADKIYLSTWPPLNFRNTGAARAGAWQDPLYEILGDGTGKTIVIDEKDYDQARARVRHRVNQELNEAVATVDQAQDHDPENALYNYYKANLYFELGQPDLAVRELQMAVGKPAVRTYYDERQKAVAKALAAANAPSAVRSHVEPFAPIGDYMRNWIWKPHVVPLARKNEEEGDLAKAKKIYELSMGMAKHIREELPPDAEELLPHALDHDRSVARAIETWADERLASLRERREPPEGARGGPPEK